MCAPGCECRTGVCARACACGSAGVWCSVSQVLLGSGSSHHYGTSDAVDGDCCKKGRKVGLGRSVSAPCGPLCGSACRLRDHIRHEDGDSVHVWPPEFGVASRGASEGVARRPRVWTTPPLVLRDLTAISCLWPHASPWVVCLPISTATRRPPAIGCCTHRSRSLKGRRERRGKHHDGCRSQQFLLSRTSRRAGASHTTRLGGSASSSNERARP